MLNAQVIGDKKNLGTKPEGSPSQGVHPVNLQRVGDSVDLQKTPTASPSAIASKGSYQVIGDTVNLSHTPNKNVGNNSLLQVSDKGKQASEVGSIPKASTVRP